MEVDLSKWSGEGELTQAILDRLRTDARIALVRIEDSPAAREDTTYSFISNEVFLGPLVARHGLRRLWPLGRPAAPSVTLDDVEATLRADDRIGSPDFADRGMLQYLRTQRIVPPYQTRGYKLVELVRVYMAGSVPSL